MNKGYIIPFANKFSAFMLLLFSLKACLKIRNRAGYSSLLNRLLTKKSSGLKYRKLISKGYTLIEVIIALAVFAILSTLTASVMLQAFNTKKHLAVEADRMRQLQISIPLIRRDIEQILNRPVRGNERRLFPPFIGEADYTEFTRGGFVNPSSILKTSSLQRVAYLCSEKTLTRRSWTAVDSPVRSQYQDKVILKNLTGCSFHYISHHQEKLSSWRPYAVSQYKNTAIPAGIQFSLTFNSLGKIELLFPIPEGIYA